MITRAFRHLILDNPMTLEGTRVWRRFLRTGGDTGRTVNAVVAALLGLFYLWVMYAIVRYSEDLCSGLLLVELMLLTLIVPASLYGAISSEREKLTWDALILTRLTPGQITIGKLLWRVVIILGLQLVFVPLLLLSHSVGTRQPDYTLRGLLESQMDIFAWSLLLAGFSLWVSAKTKRSVTSLSLITAGLLGFLAVVPGLFVLFGNATADMGTNSPLLQIGQLLTHLNPIAVLLDTVMRSDEPSTRLNDPWYAANMYRMTAEIYGVGALIFLNGAWRTLRGLEIARKTRR